MTVTMEDVRAALDPEEPRYRQAALLGEEALPHLQDLVAGSAGTGLAAKAAYLASLIESPAAHDILLAAADSDEPIVRIAAAGALRNVSEQIQDDVARRLLDDDDIGVRKTALVSLGRVSRPGAASSPLIDHVESVVQRESEPRLRELAEKAVLRLRGDG